MEAPRANPEVVLTRADLGCALTALRASSGLTVRELARRIETPLATVGDYCSGRHLPGPAQLDRFRQLLEACGVTDEEDLRSWMASRGSSRCSATARCSSAR